MEKISTTDYEPLWTYANLETNEYMTILAKNIANFLEENRDIYKKIQLHNMENYYEKHINYIGNLNDFLNELEEISNLGWNLNKLKKIHLNKIIKQFKKFVHDAGLKHRIISQAYLTYHSTK